MIASKPTHVYIGYFSFYKKDTAFIPKYLNMDTLFNIDKQLMFRKYLEDYSIEQTDIITSEFKIYNTTNGYHENYNILKIYKLINSKYIYDFKLSYIETRKPYKFIFYYLVAGLFFGVVIEKFASYSKVTAMKKANITPV